MSTLQLLESLAHTNCNPASIEALLADQPDEIKSLFAQNNSAGLKKHLASGKDYFADAVAITQIFNKLTAH